MLTGHRTEVQRILCALLGATLLGQSAWGLEQAAKIDASKTAPPTTASPTVAPPTTAAPLDIARLFSAPDLSGASLRSPRFSPDGRLVTFLRGKDTDKDRLDIWAYDVAKQQSFLLVDSTELVSDEGSLSPEEEARRERARTAALRGIVDYEFSADSQQILIPLAGDLYLYSLKSSSPATETATKVRQLTRTPAAETDARFSPQGRYVSFVREQNLYFIDLQSGQEHAVTTEGGGTLSFGMAEFIAQEEMDRSTGYWWSPDERHIAYTRVDESGVDELERFEIFADSVKVVRQRYPAAGRSNASVTLQVVSLDPVAAPGTGKSKLTAAREMPAAASGEGYLARVDWFPDSRHLAVQWQSRNQKYLVLRRIDIRDASARDLIEERSDSWIDLHDELTLLRSGRFIWASSRSGYKHLYLHDFDGRLIRPITAGQWMVVGDARERAIEAVDERGGRVYFSANRKTPIERHLHVAPLTGPRSERAVEAGIRQISQGDGWHSVTMSDDGRRWLDLYSTPAAPPSLSLRDARGQLMADLVPNTLDDNHPYAPYASAHRPAEFGTLPAADGQWLHYEILKPANFDPNRRYPVIVDVYGGPGVQRVRRAWGGAPAGLFRQILAQRGFVVFTLDNRGSGFRGRQFESALYRRMGSIEIEDQVRGVEFLRSLPWVDDRRVGVFGWSYGGYMALMSMVRAPEIFAAGVAGAPVTDWRLYDTHYTERYMSTPEDNPQGYADGMVMTHADALQGPLLIMHGMADDNVLFTHATALFKRLQDLQKPFAVMPYPGSKHGLLRFADTGPHAYASILDFFEDHLQRRDLGTEATAP